LNWSKSFDARLSSWCELRHQVKSLPVVTALIAINQWWFAVPWRPYHLHWDDMLTWPDPWQLLSDNIYCDIARGLGIMYTISLLDRADLADAELVLTADQHNLVQVCDSKYILNWDRDCIVNINLQSTITKTLTLGQLESQYNL
jgi:hypothetical protein